MRNPQTSLTDLIRRAAEHDKDAKEELYANVYDELRSVAHRFMRKQRVNDLQTTALVNEVVLRFERCDAFRRMENRRVFFSVAIQAMNQVLVDHYRRRKELIDSPDRTAEPLDDAVHIIEQQVGSDFESLQCALESLAAESPRQHAVIMHRFFGGLSVRETATMLDVSEKTIERDWRLARARLFRELNRKLS